jgi:RimJ/RimL family protein N-acetyltransferase
MNGRKNQKSLATLAATTLEGGFVRLEPLSLDHAPEFLEIASDEEIWQYMADEPLRTLEDVRARIADEIENAIPMAIRIRRTGAFAGCVEYIDVQPENESVEIGYLWVGLRYRGTPAAAEAQWLMTRHAFDHHGAGRVWLTTDARNRESNASLRTFGIPLEGCLRRDLRMSNGSFRDTNVYSVIIDEWPELRYKGEAFMHGLAQATHAV